MDYQLLFQQNDRFDEGDNFCCTYYRDGGSVELCCRSDYSILFVLQGTLEMRFKYMGYSVGAGQLVAIDKQALIDFRTAPSTILLIYRPPLRLEEILSQCSKIYDTPFSSAVPILPPLQRWIDSLLEQNTGGRRWTEDEAHKQRKELARIFMDYPCRELQELRAVFLLCVWGDCKYCHQKLFTP